MSSCRLGWLGSTIPKLVGGAAAPAAPGLAAAIVAERVVAPGFVGDCDLDLPDRRLSDMVSGGALRLSNLGRLRPATGRYHDLWLWSAKCFAIAVYFEHRKIYDLVPQGVERYR